MKEPPSETRNRKPLGELIRRTIRFEKKPKNLPKNLIRPSIHVETKKKTAKSKPERPPKKPSREMKLPTSTARNGKSPAFLIRLSISFKKRTKKNTDKNSP